MSALPILIGLDIGTTSVKAVAYAPTRGQTIAVASRPTPIVHPRPGWSHFPPDQLWDAVVESVRELVATLPDKTHVLAVGIASVGEAGLPVDEQGHPLHPIIAWFDPRGEKYVQQWRRQFDVRWIYLTTGHTPRSLYTAFKILWLWEHAPQAMRRLHKWLFVGDYIAFRMTGAQATVPTLAARSLLFDVVKRRWHPELVTAARLRVEQLPQAVETHTVVGQVTAEVAAATGLPAGTPVALGGHDHVVGMFAAGLSEPGIVVDSTGTAQATATHIPEFIGERGYEVGFTCYPFVVGGGYILQGGMPSAGSALAWMADQFTEGDVEALLDLAAQSPIGSRGVGCIPFFRGSGPPHPRSDARALFFHVGLEHGPADLARALVEGLACFSANVITLFAPLVPQPLREIRAIGGGNRHPLVLASKAGVTGLPVARVGIAEAVGTSAAALAGIACGYFADAEEARSSMRLQLQRVAPDPQWTRLRQRVLERYRTWAAFVVAHG